MSKLAQLFLRAAKQVDASSIPLTKPTLDELGGPAGTCFLHLQYHVQDTPRRTLQQLFDDTCMEAFTKAGVPVSRMIAAYKRSSHIADVTRWNRLNDVTNTIPNQGPALKAGPIPDQMDSTDSSDSTRPNGLY
jgi:hypothetical protein